ncbi:MAG TPA: hypothetical protein VGH83_01090 [Candidatus Acidoferrum sp.]|jgi:hypothetical protein
MAEAKRTTVNEAEEIELEFKRLQIEQMRESLNETKERKARRASERERNVVEWKKGEEIKAHRQRICKHRKGGKDNKFAAGNDNNHSIIQNTYPDGTIVIMCTRCFHEVPKPSQKLKKENPKLYAEMWEEWRIWSQMPTDNTPSGSKIFEIVA